MSKCRHTILAVIVLTVAASCVQNHKKSEFKPVHMVFSEPPAMMEPQAKAYYVTQHYWDDLLRPGRGYPCADSSLISGVARREVEQAVANYSILLGQMPLDKARSYITALAVKLAECERSDTSSNVFEELTSLLQRYLYDPNSPLRDEDVYCPFARQMSECELIDSSRRAVFAKDAALSALNPRGSVAADFAFSTASGRVYTMHGIKADYTVLFFSNPGCTACKDIIDALNSSEVIAAKIESGELAVLNIYIDEQLKEWYEYMSIYPDKWYNGYDHNYIIRSDELYNVRAIPSLYFLDRDKRVLLKDVTVEKLMNNLPWQQ